MTPEATTYGIAHEEKVEETSAAEIQVFGFWIYLMSDLIIFATLFAAFGTLGRNFAGGPTGRDLFDLKYTLGETLFLLFSSACYGLVMLAVWRGRKKWALAALAVTFILGLGFVLMEIHEFYGLVAQGAGPDRSGFLSSFFALVGTHGTHVTVGLIWMLVMMAQIAVKGLTTPVQSRLLRLSMFWHFLDIVWVGVFTIVYLMGVM